MKKLLVKHEQVPLKPKHKVEVPTVTLSFYMYLMTWFLFMIYCFVMMIICPKLFLNPTKHDRDMGRTGTGFTEANSQSLRGDCDLDL